MLFISLQNVLILLLTFSIPFCILFTKTFCILPPYKNTQNAKQQAIQKDGNHASEKVESTRNDPADASMKNRHRCDGERYFSSIVTVLLKNNKNLNTKRSTFLNVIELVTAQGFGQLNEFFGLTNCPGLAFYGERNLVSLLNDDNYNWNRGIHQYLYRSPFTGRYCFLSDFERII